MLLELQGNTGIIIDLVNLSHIWDTTIKFIEQTG